MNGQEVELKLALERHDLNRLRRHAPVMCFRRKRSRSLALASTYFDTPDLTLAQAGITIRLRQDRNTVLQTVKTSGQCRTGLFARGEWEAPIAGTAPSPAHLYSTGLPLLKDPAVIAMLRPIFTTTVTRRIYDLEADDGSWSIEMVLDDGAITTETRAQDICEVELELRRGTPRDLFFLAKLIRPHIPVRLLSLSKSDRGYRLVQGIRSTPAKSKIVPLTTAMSQGEAFQAIARECLSHLHVNELALLDGTPPEAIHQMRVALRRLRSAMRLFKTMIDSPETSRLQGEIRWLLSHLGPARDGEVFLGEILDPVVSCYPGHAGLQALRAEWAARRDSDVASAVAAVRDPRYGALILDLAAWAEEASWRETSFGPSPLAPLAKSWLDKALRRLRRGTGKDLAALPPLALHQVRIHGKRLRYAAEFFSSLYPGKATRNYAAALAQLQDCLGAVNDYAVAMPKLAANHHQGELSWAAGLVCGWHEARRHGMMAEAKSAWSRLRRMDPFWRD